MRLATLWMPAACVAASSMAFAQNLDTAASRSLGNYTPPTPSQVAPKTPDLASPPQGASGTITEYSDRVTFENAVGVPLTLEDFTDQNHFPLESAFLNSESSCAGCGNPLFPGDIQPGVTYFANGNPGEAFFFNIDSGGNYPSGPFLDGFAGSPWFTTQAEMDFWGSSPSDARSISAFGFDCAFQGGAGIEVIISFDTGPDQMFTYPQGSGLTFFGFQSDATDIKSVIIRTDPASGSFFGFDFDNFTFETAPATVCTPGSLATTLASNNGGSVDWMTLMDIDVVNPNGMDVTGFDINDNNAGTGGGAVEIDIYITPDGLAGKETDPGAWMLVATGSATAMPENTATFVDTSDFNLAPGLWGVGIHYRVGSGPAYTNGDGTNENYSNCDMDLNGCCSITGLFAGTIFSPRIFNGAVYTCAVASGGRSYCTAKTNSCGTVPSISGAGVPSSSATSGHTISGSNANNNKSGLLIYTDGGPAAVPFQGGTLCISPAIRRTPPTFSGGSSGCDGTFDIDMNAFASGNGGGNPQAFLLTPGQNVHCQWWGRDTVGNGSYLSDGLNYCVGL